MSFTFCLSLRTNQIGASIRFLNTFSHADVCSKSQLWIFFILYNKLIRFNSFDRKYILYHTHLRSGNTSHDPSSLVPPHGPLRIRFGQFWLQIKAVEDNIHSPQCWQRNNGTFIISSKKSRRRETFRSLAVIGGLFIVTKFSGKGISSCFDYRLYLRFYPL
jgi:hypothetical protein